MDYIKERHLRLERIAKKYGTKNPSPEVESDLTKATLDNVLTDLGPLGVEDFEL